MDCPEAVRPGILPGWMSPSRRSQFQDYLVAISAVVTVTALRILLRELGFVSGQPYLLFTAPIIVAGWMGGLGAGICATLLSAVSLDYFFLPSDGLAIRLEDLFPQGVFIVEGVLISWLSARKKQ